MNILPFLKKDSETPDAYGLTLNFIDGKSAEYEVASHRIIQATSIFEIVTKDDQWMIFPLSNLKSVAFDKRFSKIVALTEKGKEAK